MSVAPMQRKAPEAKAAAPKPAVPKPAAPAPAPSSPAAAAPVRAPTPMTAPPEAAAGPSRMGAPVKAPAVQRATRPGVPVEPHDSPLEREAEDAARRVVRGESVPTVKPGAQIPGAVARAPREVAIDASAERAPTAHAALDAGHALTDPGEPLSAHVRRLLEERFRADLSDVRVHRDGRADRAAQEMQARAFTEGSHIWLSLGESADDVQLMAHEVTHVLQQRGSPGRPARVMRNSTASPAGAPGVGSEPTLEVREPLQIPPIKSRHEPAYRARAGRHALRRPLGYNAATRETAQVNVWNAGVTLQLARIPARYRTATGGCSLPLQRQGGAALLNVVEADEGAMQARLKRPNWDPDGEPVEYQVDHMVEFQLGGDDSIGNLELLNQAHNGSVGSSFGHEIRRAIRTELEARPPVDNPALTVTEAMATRAIVFEHTAVRGRESRRREGDSTFWSKHAIESLEHVVPLLPPEAGAAAGTARRLSVLSPTGSLVVTRMPIRGDAIAVPDGGAGGIAGFKITSVELTSGIASLNTLQPGAEAGRLVGELDLGSKVAITGSNLHTLSVLKAPEQFAVRIGAREGGNEVPAEFTPLSPMRIRELSFGRGVFATSTIRPNHPLLAGLQIPAQIRDGRVGLFHTVDMTTLAKNINVPGVTIDAASITFSYDGTDFGVNGGAEFSINRLGRGALTAAASTGGQFGVGASFNFDTRYFDPARLAFTYDVLSGAWSGSGDIGLKPNTIPGVEAAAGHVDYDGTTFNGSLMVTPKIRAIQQGRLDFRYSEAEGARFAGTLTLSDQIPNVRNGEVQVVLTKAPQADDWGLTATGDLQSGFAGFNQRLHLEYTNGGFVVEGAGDFKRGMLSGQVTLGATNYTVDPNGQRGDTPTDTIIAYGSGQVSVTLTPWLVAAGRIRLLPNGEVELFGELSLPPALPVFDEIPYQRRLFSINLDIPIIGFAVAGQRIGIFATIGGGLDLNASLGPGQLRDTRLNITYNPSHEDQTAIHGQARFVVPAQASLRAFIRGALGAGIPIVSASLGLEAGGQLGLYGEAAAEANVDWSPGHGLVLDATGSVFVEPRFRFDLTGFLEVTADLWVKEIDLYSRRWELAAFEVGPALRLGVEFPVHYEEGQPSQVSWDAVRFTVPDVDLRALIGDVIDQVV